MAAWIRRYFPHIEPYELEPDRFAILWRDAQFIIEQTKPLKNPPV